MANIASQKKRILVTRKENARNVSIRSGVRNAIKRFNAACAAGDVALADRLFPETVSIINKAHSAGVLPANTASRKVATISRIYAALKGGVTA